jgi:hypothetical protein
VRDLCAPQIDNDERYVIRYMVFRCVKNYTVTPGVMILCSGSIHTKTHSDSDSHKRPKNVNQRARPYHAIPTRSMYEVVFSQIIDNSYSRPHRVPQLRGGEGVLV